MKLEQIRKEVDVIDEKILLLLHKRFALIKKIRLIKKKQNLPIQNKNREKEIIDRIIKKSQQLHTNKHLLINIFKKIIEESKRIQK